MPTIRSCSPSRYKVSTVSSVRQTIRCGGNIVGDQLRFGGLSNSISAGQHLRLDKALQLKLPAGFASSYSAALSGSGSGQPTYAPNRPDLPQPVIVAIPA